MKKRIILFVLVMACFPAMPSSRALTSTEAKAIRQAMLSVPPPEMPSRAVELVSRASREDREAVALAALRAAVFKHRSSAPTMVAALVKAAPDSVAAITRTAAEMDSTQVGPIANAAITAAPTSKSKIISAVSQGAVPATSSPGGAAPAFLVSSLPMVNTRGSFGGGDSDGPHVFNRDEPINPGPPDHPHNHFHGPPPWAAGPPDHVDYSRPRRP